MLHFHLQFISAGFGIGLVLTFVAVSAAQAASWQPGAGVPLASWLVAAVALISATIITAFCWDVIRQELRPRKKKRYARRR